jgi:hypothetical protein
VAGPLRAVMAEALRHTNLRMKVSSSPISSTFA